MIATSEANPLVDFCTAFKSGWVWGTSRRASGLLEHPKSLIHGPRLLAITGAFLMPRTWTPRVDDAVMAIADFQNAKRVLDVLGERLARYGLTLHPNKTRFVDFRAARLAAIPAGESPANRDAMGEAAMKSRRSADC